MIIGSLNQWLKVCDFHLARDETVGKFHITIIGTIYIAVLLKCAAALYTS